MGDVAGARKMLEDNASYLLDAEGRARRGSRRGARLDLALMLEAVPGGG